MRLSIGEIFEQGSKLEGAEQVGFFRKQWTPTLGIIIQHAFEPAYQFDLPDGEPPFKENELIDQESNLYGEVRRLYIFLKPHENIKKHGGHVSAIKKEMLWIGLLENVSALDAKVLLAVKDKHLPFGVTASRLKEIFPGVLSDQAVDQEQPEAEPTVEVEPEPKKAPIKKKAPAKKPAAKRKAPPKKKPAAKKKAPAKKSDA